MADDLRQRSVPLPPDHQTPGGRDSEQQPEGRSPDNHGGNRITTGEREHGNDVDDVCGDNSTKDAHVIDSNAQDLRHRCSILVASRVLDSALNAEGQEQWVAEGYLRGALEDLAHSTGHGALACAAVVDAEVFCLREELSTAQGAIARVRRVCEQHAERARHPWDIVLARDVLAALNDTPKEDK